VGAGLRPAPTPHTSLFLLASFLDNVPAFASAKGKLIRPIITDSGAGRIAPCRHRGLAHTPEREHGGRRAFCEAAAGLCPAAALKGPFSCLWSSTSPTIHLPATGMSNPMCRFCLDKPAAGTRKGEKGGEWVGAGRAKPAPHPPTLLFFPFFRSFPNRVTGNLHMGYLKVATLEEYKKSWGSERGRKG